MSRRIFVAAIALAMACVAQADDRIFFCNYDVVLIIDDTAASVNSRARVRDGHTIPIEFQEYKIDVHVAGGDGDGVNFAITIFERSEQFWYAINPEPLKFAGTLGIPVQFQWKDGRVSLDVAISVSVQGRLE